MGFHRLDRCRAVPNPDKCHPPTTCRHPPWAGTRRCHRVSVVERTCHLPARASCRCSRSPHPRAVREAPPARRRCVRACAGPREARRRRFRKEAVLWYVLCSLLCITNPDTRLCIRVLFDSFSSCLAYACSILVHWLWKNRIPHSDWYTRSRRLPCVGGDPTFSSLLPLLSGSA